VPNRPDIFAPLPTPDQRERAAVPGVCLWQTNKTMTYSGTAAGNTNVDSAQRTATWETPIFDMYPELRGIPESPSFAKSGTYPLSRQGQLVIQVSFRHADEEHGNAFGLAGMNITAWDEANPWNPQDMRPIIGDQDVTSTFISGTSPYGIKTQDRGVSGLLFWSPPSGNNGPVRFWQFHMTFSIWIAHPDPVTVVTAAFY
jgi:hypothetical protein